MSDAQLRNIEKQLAEKAESCPCNRGHQYGCCWSCNEVRALYMELLILRGQVDHLQDELSASLMCHP